MKILFLLLIFISVSCHRQASCPTYNSVDRLHHNIDSSREKFIYLKKNKKDTIQLDTIIYKNNRNKSLNLFPSYMR